MTTQTHPTVYTQQIAAAISQALQRYQLLAKVGLRQTEGLLYVALEPVTPEAEPSALTDTTTLLSFLNKTLGRLKGELALKWVKLVKVSGRLPNHNLPLWQEDLLPFAGAPQIARTLAKPAANPLAKTTAKSPTTSTVDGEQDARTGNISTGDVSINIGGNVSAPLVVGHGNQLYSYTYNVEHGGVLNIASPPTISPRRTPIRLKPKPFPNLLDRQTVLPILQASLSHQQPVEVYATPGFGKTTLMRHVAHWHEVTAGFADGVLYLPVAKQPAADLLQSLYDIFYEAVPAFKPSYGQVQQALKEKQALVILNGLSLEKEEMEWLMAALPNCTFVLVSDERLYWQEGADIALAGLPLEDAIALLQRDLSRSLSDPEKTAAQTLHQALSGNPLQLRRAAAQVKSSQKSLDQWLHSVQAQQRQTAAANAGLSDADLKKLSLNRAVFTTATQKLSPAQKRVLALLGAMGGVALSTEQAQAISQTPETANALSDLANLQLVEPTEAGYQLCADLGEAVSQTFELRPWLQSATDYFVRTSTDASANSDAMLHLLEWTQQTGQWQQSLQLAQNLEAALATSGQWQQWQQVLTHSLQAAQQVGNGSAEAWALHQLGTSAIALNNLKQAETWLSRAVTLRETLKDLSGAAVSRHNLGLLVPPLIAGQGLVPTSSSPSNHKFSRFVSLGVIVGGLLVSGTGIAFWLGAQSPDGEINASRAEIAQSEDAQIVEVNEPADAGLGLALGLAFDNSSLSFGKVLIGRSTRKPVNITNRSQSSVPIPALSTTAPEEFSVIDQTCKSGTIEPNQSCTITILFEPRGEGDRISTLIASNNAQDSAQSNDQNRTTLPLTGTGITQNTTDSAPSESNSTLTLEELEEIPSIEIEQPSLDPEKPTEEQPEAENNPSEEPASNEPSIEENNSVDNGPEEISLEENQTGENASEEAGESEEEIPEAETNNQPPVVQDIDLQVKQGEPYTFNLLQISQAYDPDPGDSVEVFGIGAIEAGGTLENNGDGTATYYPYTGVAPDQFGIYQNNFEFSVIDSRGAKAYGTVFITVTIPEPTPE